MILKIKNMVSSRCKTFVHQEMNNLGIYNVTVELGEVELSDNIPEEKLRLLDKALRSAGLELLENRELRLVEQIKEIINELIFENEDITKPNFSDIISQKTNHSYTHLSNIFSETEGKTIEKYIIGQRIERVKELLIYTDLSLEVIAFKLHYSSQAHLSNQFKKFTGMTTSFFRKQRNPSSKLTEINALRRDLLKGDKLKPVAK